MLKGHTISLVIPCYNEEKGIAFVLRDRLEIFDEVVVVDNGSTDETAAVACELGARVVTERVRGYGASVGRGLKEAVGDIIVTLDGDGTYPMEAVPYLVSMLENEGLDFITVQRKIDKMTKAETFLRHGGTLILNCLLCILFGVRLQDSQSGMWVLRKSILGKIKPSSSGFFFSTEIKIEAFRNIGIKAKEIPCKFYSHRFGESKLSVFFDGLRIAFLLFKKRFTRS